MIPRDVVEAVRDQTDIVQVVSRTVRLERRGGSWVGLCPFHQEKSPSFNVIPHKAMYYCFGCQAGGDVIRFVMLTENLSFFEAVQQLASPLGITVETRELSEDERRKFATRAKLYDVLEAAAGWFESQLWTSTEGEEARDYLVRRGISDELARKARLGWAPPAWDRLCGFLRDRGFPADLARKSGLVKVRERDGGFYDAFRGRLMIPIRDERGRTIAFGGRILSGDGPKYINSDESDLYHKSSVLYALDMAANAIRQKRRIILVEGYFDVLSMHQAGFTEAVATCGTALTPKHVERILKLSARDVIFLSDSDAAGQLAAEKAAEEQLKVFETDVESQRVLTWRLDLPDAKDPDELIRERGPEAMERAIDQRTPLVQWLIRRKLTRYGRTAQGKERALDEMLALLQEISQAQAAEIAAHLGIAESMVYQRMQVRRARPPAAAAPEPTGWRSSQEVRHLLWLLVHRYEQVADLVQRIDPAMIDPMVREVVGRLLQGEAPVRLVEDASDEAIRQLLATVVARTTLYAPEEAATAVCQVLVRIARPVWEERAATLQSQATEALRGGDTARYRALGAARKAGTERWRRVEDGLRTGDLSACVDELRAMYGEMSHTAPQSGA